ncbi:MAG: MMPL family transporter, partial [Acidimicrobiales bacterium]|nr:MMPL family transporter [Acidimicrobiales bacterium]
MFASLGRWCFRNRRSVLLLWALLLVFLFVLARNWPGETSGNPESPSSESNSGFEVLEQYFGGVGSGLSGTVVFEAEQGVADTEVEAAIGDYLAEVAEIDGVAAVVSPYSSQGAAQVAQQGPLAGLLAYATVDLDPDVRENQASEIGAELAESVPELDGLNVEIGGASLAEFEPPESELIGLAFAVVVLILAFGSVLAMGLPIGTAIAG